MSNMKELPEFVNGFKVLKDLGYTVKSGRNRRFASFECKSCGKEIEMTVEQAGSPNQKGCGCKALKNKKLPSELNGFKIIEVLDEWLGSRRKIIATCKVCFKNYKTSLCYIKTAESCGCAFYTPGVPRRLQIILHSMKTRTTNKSFKHYNRYGGRGIAICHEWLNCKMAFYDWALSNGYNSKLSIDRIDNDKGYSPENCRWATPAQQQRNRKVAVFQEEDVKFIRENPLKLSIKELSTKYNVKGDAISRIILRKRFADIH